MGDRLGDLGDELGGAGPGADDHDALALEVDVVVPPRRVEGGTGERARARQLGDVRPVELADPADDGVGLEGLLAAVGLQPQRPPHRRFVELRRQDLGAEADQRSQPEPIRHATEVLEQHLLAGEVLRPVVTLREGVAVEEVRHVDPAPGVGVLEPRAADVIVLLEHDHLDAGLVQPVGGDQARHAGSDHGDAERAIRGELLPSPGGRAEVLPQRELVAQQLEVVVAGAAAGHEPQQRTQLVERERPHTVGRFGAEPLDRRDRERLPLLHLGGRQPEGGIHEHREVGPQVIGHHRQVAERSGQCGEERREHPELDGGGDRVVVGVHQRSCEVGHRWGSWHPCAAAWVDGAS